MYFDTPSRVCSGTVMIWQPFLVESWCTVGSGGIYRGHRGPTEWLPKCLLPEMFGTCQESQGDMGSWGWPTLVPCTMPLFCIVTFNQCPHPPPTWTEKVGCTKFLWAKTAPCEVHLLDCSSRGVCATRKGMICSMWFAAEVPFAGAAVWPIHIVIFKMLPSIWGEYISLGEFRMCQNFVLLGR